MNFEARSLSYQYAKGFGIDDISLKLESGSFYALMGPNGCGKSTLLRLLSAVAKPKKGCVLVDGNDLFAMKPLKRASIVSFLPQTLSCDFPYSCREVVSFGRIAFSRFFPSDDDEKIFEDVMKMTGTMHLADRKITEISGGEMQRVMLAQALAQQSSVLILDEPVSHLDIACQTEIMSLLSALAYEKNLLIIASVHELSLAFSFCRELVFMKGGAIAAYGHSDDILTEALLNEVYGIDAGLIDFSGSKVPVVRKSRR